MILLTSSKDPNTITVDETHPLWHKGTSMPLYREYLNCSLPEVKKALNIIYKANRDGVAIISCDRDDLAQEIRRLIYDKAKSFMDAPVAGKTICKCDLTVEYLTDEKQVKSNIKCKDLLIKETELHIGFITSPELYLRKAITRLSLDRNKFTDHHYRHAGEYPFRVLVNNVSPIDPNENLGADEIKRFTDIEIDYLYLPYKEKKQNTCTTPTGLQLPSRWE